MLPVTSSIAASGISSSMTSAYVVEDEPFRKLVNQGMIQGRSNFVYRIKDTKYLSSPSASRISTTRPLSMWM